jgi:hypothetical protein
MVKNFLAGFACCALLFGCAGFSFKYYGLDGVVYMNGKLLGPKPEDDLPFTVCEPRPNAQHPCVVMMTSDFFKYKLEFEDTQNRLKEAEKRLAECQGGRSGD